MSKFEIFRCDTCNFKFESDFMIFFLDNNQEFVETGYTKVASNLMKNSNLSGWLDKSYCSSCKKFVYIYAPNKKLTPFNKKDIISLINQFSKHDLNIITWTFKDIELEETIHCPICAENLYPLTIKENELCPACKHGHMHCEFSITYD